MHAWDSADSVREIRTSSRSKLNVRIIIMYAASARRANQLTLIESLTDAVECIQAALALPAPSAAATARSIEIRDSRYIIAPKSITSVYIKQRVAVHWLSDGVRAVVRLSLDCRHCLADFDARRHGMNIDFRLWQRKTKVTSILRTRGERSSFYRPTPSFILS